MIELFFTCPYCWQKVSILVDPQGCDDPFIEDCEVCCNPILFTVAIEDECVVSCDVQKAQ